MKKVHVNMKDEIDEMKNKMYQSQSFYLNLNPQSIELYQEYEHMD